MKPRKKEENRKENCKNKRKRKRKITLRWKLFVANLIFTALLLALLWLSETVHLDTFYKMLKEYDVNSTIDYLINHIDDTELPEYVDQMAEQKNMSILIADRDGNVIALSENNRYMTSFSEDRDEIKRFFDMTEKSGGKMKYELSELRDKGVILDENKREYKKVFQGEKRDGKNKDKAPYVSKIVKMKSGKEVLIVIRCEMAPVNATVRVIRVQLFIITIVFVFISLIIAMLLAKSISDSIVNVNKSAKKLAKGDYSVTFDGRDYREISELSDTLNYATEQLGKSEHLQKELIANVSHDLRTPLTMITAYAEIMRDIPGENTPENVQVIIDETNRLTRLVNDLLDISKIQSGVTKLETTEYDLTGSVQSAVERYAKLIEPYGYQLSFQYEDHVLVEADEFKIYQVIYNLIGNAVNYTGENKQIEVIQETMGDSVRITVRDTGVGIPQEELEFVWERYYKIDKNHKRAVLGTGLGLSIVKNILQLHHAEFGVDSKVGEGSAFWFELKGTVL